MTGKTLICAPLDGPADLPAGAKRGTCGACGAPIVIARTGQAFLLDGTAGETVCLRCIQTDLQEDYVEFAAPTAAQLVEVGAAFGLPIGQAEWNQMVAEMLHGQSRGRA